MASKVEMHHDICENLNGIYYSKNKDYGDSFGKSYTEYGKVMAAIRLEDKLNRFKSLIKPGTEASVKDESIEDTLLDMANYAILTVIEMRLENDRLQAIAEMEAKIIVNDITKGMGFNDKKSEL